jgi:biliverdin reductase
VQGDRGALIFESDRGTLIQSQGTTPLEIGARRGLFAKDTAMVLDYLLEKTPLYVSPKDSLYTLRVANAAERSAETGSPVTVG